MLWRRVKVAERWFWRNKILRMNGEGLKSPAKVKTSFQDSFTAPSPEGMSPSSEAV